MALPPPWKLVSSQDVASGGQAQVFPVANPAIDGKFALKRLTNPARRERFVRELEQMKLLADRGVSVPPIVAFDTEDLRPWFVMPWYDNGSAESFIAGSAAAAPATRLDFLAKLAKVLSEVHECRLAHRDLKPANEPFPVAG